jgi:putative transposase
MPPVPKALVRTALREDAEKVVFGDREGRAPRPKPTRRRPQGLCLDRGYDYDEVRALAEEFGFTCHIRSRGEERALKREAGFRARRWVVERTISWLHQYRRLRLRYERRADIHEAFLQIAGCLICLKLLQAEASFC